MVGAVLEVGRLGWSIRNYLVVLGSYGLEERGYSRDILVDGVGMRGYVLGGVEMKWLVCKGVYGDGVDRLCL